MTLGKALNFPGPLSLPLSNGFAMEALPKACVQQMERHLGSPNATREETDSTSKSKGLLFMSSDAAKP